MTCGNLRYEDQTTEKSRDVIAYIPQFQKKDSPKCIHPICHTQMIHLAWTALLQSIIKYQSTGNKCHSKFDY